MRRLVQPALRRLLQRLGRYPAVKRALSDIVYRIPALDSALRTAAHRLAHPDAVLDVDARQLPEASRRSFERMRNGPAP